MEELKKSLQINVISIKKQKPHCTIVVETTLRNGFSRDELIDINEELADFFNSREISTEYIKTNTIKKLRILKWKLILRKF